MIDKVKEIIDIFPDFLVLSNKKSIILDVSKSIMEKYGAQNKNEFIRKSIFEFIALGQHEIALEILKRTLNEGGSKNRIYKLKKKDGTFFYGELNVTFFKGKTRKDDFFMTLIRDITSTKFLLDEVNTSKKMFQLVLDNIPQFIFWKDINLKYQGCNKNFARVAGVNSPEKIVGKTDFELAWKTEQAESSYETDLLVMESNKPEYHIIESQLQANKKEAWLDVNKIPLTNSEGDVIGLLGTYEDITERVNTELALRKSEEKFREAYNRAEFLRDLFSHDMNNILQSIQIANDFNELLIETNDLEKLKLNCERIKESVSRAARLIRNVKKFSQIEESKSTLQPLDVVNALKSSKEFIIKTLPNKEIEIKMDIPFEKIFINANELLHDLFENILINAINHNLNQKIEILIKVSNLKKENNNYIKIQIIDNGIGIEDKRKKTIFDRAYNIDKNTSGSGLGLSLVKKIADGFRGEIWVEDRIKEDYSKGSNFIILIPEA